MPSCDDFGNVNSNPESLTGDIMDFRYLFTGVEASIAGTEWEVWRNGMIYSSTMMQHCSSTTDYWCGDKYTYRADYNEAYWGTIYGSGVRSIFEVLNKWQGDETQANAYNMARILKVMVFHRITDMYGDIPYSEAGRGYLDNLFYPKYDSQQEIYADMLKELKEAAEALDTSAANTMGAADIIYQGDPVKWKKFAYSLMVRLAMRLSKADPDQAKTWVNTAVAGGIFVSNDDNAIILHTGAINTTDGAEPFGKVVVHSDPDKVRLSDTFVSHLKNTQDPRLI
jgi:hypothetical protein